MNKQPSPLARYRRSELLGIACVLAGSFVLLPPAASAVAPLPISIDTTYVEVTASRGEHVARSFKFWNGTDAFLPIHLQAADFAPQGEEGVILVDGEEDPANSLKSWVTPDIPDLEVAPKQEITLGYSIDVPSNADPGSHWGTLLSVTAPQNTPGGAAVQARLGFIIYVRVPGNVREGLALESFSAPRALESPPIAIEARFKNEGTVHEAPKGTIEVRNMFGALVATGTLPVRNVLPGVVRRIDTTVGAPGLWLGRYAVSIHATYGESNAALDATKTVWIVPWRTQGWKALIGIAVVAWAIWQRRRFYAFFYVLRTGEAPPKDH